MAPWTVRQVCVSESVRQFSQSAGRLDPTRLMVIPNGVDVARFAVAVPCSPQSLGLRPGARAIVFVGRLDRQKGIAELIEAAPSFLAALPDHDLVVVGRGDLAEQVVARARQLGIDQRVHFTGWRSDVPEILAAADLVVIPSAWEGMCNVMLEAMAAGKLLIARQVEGAAEVLAPVGTEQLCGPGVQVLSEAIVKAASSPDIAAQIGAKNRQRVEQFFTLDAMAARYAELYRELISERNCGC